MVIINKRKAYIVLIGIAVLVIIISIIKLRKPETTETVALPIKNKTIIIDAGHRPERIGGAVAKDGTSEAEINLKIALKVKSLLEQAGSKVILTRSNDEGIYDVDKTTLRQKKISDLKNRVKIGNESNADIFVSIHLNKISEEQYWGWQTFFKDKNEQSKKLAECIQNGLNKTIQKENKRETLKIENIYIVDNVEIPISVVECGFLSNNEELELLKTNEYQDKLALGIYEGIMDYFLE